MTIFPSLVREAESDVVAQLVVAKQKLETRLDRIGIDEIRALPSEDVAGALSQHGLESHSIDLLADAVGIYQLGISESLGSDSEMILDSFDMLFHLVLELTLIGEGGKRVVICLSEELHLTGIGQFLETPHHLRLIPVELLKSGTGDREGDFEILPILLDKIQKQLVHRKIALLGNPMEDGPVREIIIVMGVLADIKETVQSQPGGLMDLEI